MKIMRPKLVSQHHTTLQASFVVQTPLTKPLAAARRSRCGAIAVWPLDRQRSMQLKFMGVPLFTTKLDRDVASVFSLTIMAVLQGVRIACRGSASIG